MELTIQAVDELSIPVSRRHYALLFKCEVNMVEYHCSQFSLNGHLYKMDTLLKQILPCLGPCLSLVLLVDSLKDGHLTKTNI